MKNKIVLLLFLSTILYAREVLLLNSYHKGYEWTDSVTKGVEKGLFYSDVEITYEYMDTKRIYNQEYLVTLFQLYKQRYKTRKFDLIIAADNNALEFLNTYSDKLFTNTPIIFCGINNFDKQTFLNSNIAKRATGVVEEVDIEKNIQLIQKLHPNTKKLLVVNDTTTTGLGMKKEFDKISNKYKNALDIEYVDKFKIESLREKVKNLDENSVILFMLLFKDETGKVFTFIDGLKEIEEHTSVPIYGLWDFYVKHGLVGGYVTNGYEQGLSAAKMARVILGGKEVSQIPILEKSPNRYMFDYEKLKKFGIEVENLPENHIMKNEPGTFYENYQTELTTITIAFIVFTIIIFLLIGSLEDKRQAQEELAIQLNFIESLLDTIKNPIFYKDKNGRYLGCNNAFSNFTGIEKKAVMGKTMYDVFKEREDFFKIHEVIEKKLFKNEKVDEYIMDYHIQDTIKTVIISKSLYHNNDQEVEGILTVLHDITDIVKIQNEKKQHESFLIQQSKLAEIGEMINAIAHQWNEPLVEMSAIVQDLELQHKTAKISDDDINCFVKDSMIQIQYMSKTLKDFRDFLKPSAQKSNFVIEDAFNEILNIIERQIKYSYIDLNIEYNCPNLIVYGYKNEFMQVLITILNNSKDAILQLKLKDIYYNGKIDVIVSSKEDIVEILIIDNGSGIKQKDKEFLFDPYYSTKEKGNGLGLYMSRILIQDKMDGKIYFKDTKECTTLAIELPKKAKI
ncbi:MAG: ABC transporter substrate binding protein [Arcobacteraceae bacterium]